MVLTNSKMDTALNVITACIGSFSAVFLFADFLQIGGILEWLNDTSFGKVVYSIIGAVVSLFFKELIKDLYNSLIKERFFKPKNKIDGTDNK